MAAVSLKKSQQLSGNTDHSKVQFVNLQARKTFFAQNHIEISIEARHSMRGMWERNLGSSQHCTHRVRCKNKFEHFVS